MRRKNLEAEQFSGETLDLNCFLVKALPSNHSDFKFRQVDKFFNSGVPKENSSRFSVGSRS